MTEAEEAGGRIRKLLRAAGHNQNNELTIIVTMLAVAIEATDADDPMRALLIHAEHAALRLSGQAGTFLKYSTLPEPDQNQNEEV